MISECRFKILEDLFSVKFSRKFFFLFRLNNCKITPRKEITVILISRNFFCASKIMKLQNN